MHAGQKMNELCNKDSQDRQAAPQFAKQNCTGKENSRRQNCNESVIEIKILHV